ncbi:hypothetical protein LBMAG53_03350 [Planctomycetota bacterium]|nr:hypothetical protein LBMAG53_03350 [Planctomycetota bacterium]
MAAFACASRTLRVEPHVVSSSNRLAVLIPTKGRHDSLRRSLPLVVVAAGRVGAAVVLCDQSATPFADPGPWTVLHRPDLSGLPAARNALLAATSAEVVLFIDDDTDLAPDFCERLEDLSADRIALGWGPVVESRTPWTRRLHRLAQPGCFRDPRRLVAGPGAASTWDVSTWALFGCCFAVRREVALATGGFDARRPGYALGEDLDFFRRLRDRFGPGRLRFTADLRAVHRRDGGDRADRYRRGFAKGRFLRWWAARHGRGDPVTLPSLLIASLAAMSGWGQEPADPRGVLAGLAGALG